MSNMNEGSTTNADVVFKVKTSRGCGSSVYFQSRDIFVTNYHVVQGHRLVGVEDRHTNVYEARVVFVNPTSDLAFLVPNKRLALPPAPCETFGEAQTRDQVFALGYPLGHPYTETKGIVSSPRQLIKGRYFVQTDAALNPGNSGGPMVNEKGELVGINTFVYIDAANMGFAIPIDILQEDLESYQLNSQNLFSVKCDSCKALTFEKSKYCSNCGTTIDEKVFDEVKLDEVEIFVEETLQRLGIKPVLAREGEAYWEFHYGVALVTVFLTRHNYISFQSPINTLPTTNIGDLYQFLLTRPLPPYKLGINNNSVFIAYHVYLTDIDSSHKEAISQNMSQFPIKADQMSRYLIQKFGCNVTHFARKGALENQTGNLEAQAAGFRQQASSLLDKGQGNESVKMLEKAKALYIKLKDKTGLAACFLLQGDIMLRYNKLKEAVAAYKKAEGFYMELEDFHGVAGCFGQQAEVYKKAKQYQVAFDYLKKEGDIYKKLKDSDALTGNWFGKGLLLMATRQFANAIEFFKLVEKYSQKNPQRMSDCYRNMADAYKGLNQNERAAEYYQKAKAVISPPAGVQTQAPAPVQPVQTVQPPQPVQTAQPAQPAQTAQPSQLEQPVQPEQPAQTTARQVQPSGEISAKTRDTLNQVRLFTEKKSMDYNPWEAEQLLRNVLKEMYVKGTLADQATLTEKLGDVLLKHVDMWEMAMTYYEKAEKLWQDMGNIPGEAACIGKQAAVLLDKSKMNEALSFLEREEKLWIEADDHLGLANCYKTRANVFIKKANWNDALETLHKEELALQKVGKGAQEKRADNWWDMGTVYGEKKDYFNQVQYWKRSVEISSRIGAPEPKREKQLKKLIKKHKIKAV